MHYVLGLISNTDDNDNNDPENCGADKNNNGDKDRNDDDDDDDDDNDDDDDEVDRDDTHLSVCLDQIPTPRVVEVVKDPLKWRLFPIHY